MKLRTAAINLSFVCLCIGLIQASAYVPANRRTVLNSEASEIEEEVLQDLTEPELAARGGDAPRTAEDAYETLDVEVYDSNSEEFDEVLDLLATAETISPEEAESEEEDKVLEVDEQALEQERRANESALIIAQARSTSAEAVELYLEETSRAGRLEILTDLLRNAEGVAFKFTVNTLVVSQETDQAASTRRLAARAFVLATERGFAINAAEALVYAFTIIDSRADHANVLESLVAYMRETDEDEEGAGCSFIHDLFLDAEIFAYERNVVNDFYRAFESSDYVDLMECILKPCQGDAADCCEDPDAVGSGRCDCETEDLCAYNIFSYRPRTIWVCTTYDCEANEKCLCS